MAPPGRGIPAAALAGAPRRLRLHPALPLLATPTQGLDADGQPLPGAPHLNLLYRDFAVSALTCCNPACANLASGSEGALSRSKCARCRRASYCGRGCQLEDWPRLKAACRHMDLL